MFKMLFNRRFAYAFVGVIVLICIVGLSLLFINKEEAPEVALIKDLGKNAFGEIQLAENLEDRNGEIASEAPDVYGLGAGGGTKEESVIMPAPDATTYKYVYKGGDFDLADSEVVVYRLAKDGSLADSLKNALNGISLKGINLNSLDNAKVLSMEIAEDSDYGYSINIDTRSNVLYISMNWQKWPVMSSSSDQVYEERTNYASISDEEAISIADSFIAKYGISMTMYGKGEVLKYSGWGLVNPNPTVVYPLEIDGQTVYDESGQKYGIYVNIDSNLKKVSNAGSINVSSFESSSYDVKITKEEAIKIAEEGGMSRDYYYISDNVIEIELGTPTIELVKIWRISDDKYNGEELFVPSLVFPVLNNPDEYFYRKSIIVPLIGGISDNVRVVPMPMIEDSVQ